MKETGAAHWINPNYGATNSAGFTALPGGDRTNTGVFANMGYTGYFWSSSENTGLYAWSRGVPYEEDGVNSLGYYRSGGFSVRCILGGGISAVLPVVTTGGITAITETSASGGGDVTSDGGAAVTERGVCWNTGGIPTTDDPKTTDGSGTGSFTSSLAGLTGEINQPVILFDKPVNRRKPQTGTFTGLFCCKKWFKNVLGILFSYPAAIITH